MGLFGLGKTPGLGIDLAVDAIKAVELEAAGDTYVVTKLFDYPLPKNLITEDEITDIELLAKQIDTVRKKLASKTKKIVTAVSGNQAISKQIAVSADLDEEAIAEKIEAEAEALIPFPINEVRYDFESLGSHPTIAGQQRVLITATRTITVDTRVQAFEEGGFDVQIMDVDIQAILRACNFLLPHLAPEIAESNKPILIVDASLASMQLMIIEDGEIIYSRYQNEGLNTLLTALDDDGEIEHSELLAKLRANDIGEFPELSLTDYLNNFWTQVTRGVQLYKNNLIEDGFAAMIVINSGAMIPALVESLREQVPYSVITLNPFDHFQLSDKLEHMRSHGPRFVEATGLALRSFTPWHM